MPKPPPDRVQAAWDLLKAPPSDEEAAAEVAHIAKLTPRELDRELEEGGVDLQQVEANAESLRQRLLGARPVDAAPESQTFRAEPSAASPFSPRTAIAVDAAAPRARPGLRRSELFSGLAIAAVLLVLAIGFAIRPHRGPELPVARPDLTSLPSPSETPSSAPPPTEAMGLRTRAADACDRKAWAECQYLLRQAARLDPAGDIDPAIQDLHERALENLPFQSGPKPQR